MGPKVSQAFKNIIPKPKATPIWNRRTPTALEYTVSLINSAPLVLFARRNCRDSHKLLKSLHAAQLEFRLVYLDDISQGSIMQRRLCTLTGQWTVPNLFAKSQCVGGLRNVTEALRVGQIKDILASDKWIELVYAVRPDALAREAVVKEKSPLSYDMCLEDSHRFGYVHRERWSKVKRYWGLEPEIEEFPIKHKTIERPRTVRKW
ncbi:glutaredoxin [Coemansia sp. RSA 552]|nr:glutaredoxin [Coemansia sp. RSA 552]